MCAINPTHRIRITFDFYTSHPVSAEEFKNKVLDKALLAEQTINNDGSIRCHVSDPIVFPVKS